MVRARAKTSEREITRRLMRRVREAEINVSRRGLAEPKDVKNINFEKKVKRIANKGFQDAAIKKLLNPGRAIRILNSAIGLLEECIGDLNEKPVRKLNKAIKRINGAAVEVNELSSKTHEIIKQRTPDVRFKDELEDAEDYLMNLTQTLFGIRAFCVKTIIYLKSANDEDRLEMVSNRLHKAVADCRDVVDSLS